VTTSVMLRYSEASGLCVERARCFGVPQHDKFRVVQYWRNL